MPITPDHVRQIFKGLESGDGTAFFRRVERARPSIVKADIVVGIRPTPPTAARAAQNDGRDAVDWRQGFRDSV
jgi:hypothetical protein